MSRFRLLSTDFDGTLIAHGSDGRCSAAFAEVLMRHKRSGGVWAINTGRSLWHAIEGVERFHAPVPPDFLLTNEREIFHRAPEGLWVPEHGWNTLCHQRHLELFDRSRDLLRRIEEFAARHPGINVVEENDGPCGVITSDEAVMAEFVGFLESDAGVPGDFSWQRNTVYLRFSHADYHKGSSLGELCRLLGIGRAQVLAAGDHHNDISMLDGRYAGSPCCPSNAIPEVVETVRAAGGHTASLTAADGVAESWHFFHELEPA
jgi:hydroxymethylpyrimidine pyrophosphatase-like HAD family hydrolase